MSGKFIIFVSFLLLITLVFSPSLLLAGPLVNKSSVSVFEKQAYEDFKKCVNKILPHLKKLDLNKLAVSEDFITYFLEILPKLQKVDSNKIKNYDFYSDKLKESFEASQNMEFKLKQVDNIINCHFYYNNKDNSLEVYGRLKFDTQKPGDCRRYTFYCNQSPSGVEYYGHIEYCTEHKGELKSYSSYCNRRSDGEEEIYNTVEIEKEHK